MYSNMLCEKIGKQRIANAIAAVNAQTCSDGQ